MQYASIPQFRLASHATLPVRALSLRGEWLVKLVYCDSSYQIEVWLIAKNKISSFETKTLPESEGVDISLDGKHVLALHSHCGKLYRGWAVDPGSARHSIAFSGDGKTLVYCN